MDCPVCGKPYGITHECTGPVDRASMVPPEWTPPTGFAPLHYLRQAIAIARWDEGAVLGASLDPNALWYGICIKIIGELLLVGGLILSQPIPANTRWLLVFVGSAILMVLDFALTLAQYGACHLLARWMYGARGSYIGVLRPLLLGSIVLWVAAIPIAGLLMSGIWGVAVMMIVFEEVDGISRLKAFGLSLAIGTAFQVLGVLLRSR